MTRALRIGLFASALGYSAYALAGCAHQRDKSGTWTDVARGAAHAEPTSNREGALTSPDVRSQKNGRAFPKGVLALTWDDGPDLRTLALAEFLKREHVSATFFVVNEWVEGVSSDPGFGPHVFETGHAKLPLLSDLVALGHRVANHTAHHTLLSKLDDGHVLAELADAQHAIDPIVRDELRLFRVPGGDWTSAASRAVDGDPYLGQLVGPIRWDVDAKDWEGSVWCESSKPSHECEHADGRYRVRAAVMAQRYEAAIESAGRGIVLMHDRVGDVGGDYAYELAQRLIPKLAARGFVFAAPILEFSAPRTRWNVAQCGAVRLGDIDGDGRGDACVRDASDPSRVTCATASWRDDAGLERVSFDESTGAAFTLPEGTRSFELADVNGDGHADVCAFGAAGATCALARASGQFDAFTTWSTEPWTPEREPTFADVDGDGKSDVCTRSVQGVSCARSTGMGFESSRTWLATAFDGAMTLGDINGDGRADLCVRAKNGIDCAVSTRAGFSHFTHWSTDSKLDGALSLADLNGDGRADLCGKISGGATMCSFSNGRTFTQATTWLPGVASAEWGRIGDVNGDGRADFCDCDASGVRCALAP